VRACKVDGWEHMEMVAKMVSPQALRKEDANLLQNEMRIWARLKHPNCVRLYAVCLDSDEYCMISELCGGGSLTARHDRLHKEKHAPLPAETVRVQMLQVAEGMRYLHAAKVMHRDLKSHNILFRSSGDLAISDFGLATFAPPEKAALTAETGSYRWMAPEVMRHEPYDQTCDVYSFGLLSWEMLTYCVPFQNLDPVEAAFAVATRSHRPTIPDHCSAEISEVIQSCWNQVSERRMTFAQVCEALHAAGKGAAASDVAPAAATPRRSRVEEPRSNSSSKNSSKRGAEEYIEVVGEMKKPRSISSDLTNLGL